MHRPVLEREGYPFNAAVLRLDEGAAVDAAWREAKSPGTRCAPESVERSASAQRSASVRRKRGLSRPRQFGRARRASR
eukprot:4449861-Prymnesium_polylepis.1